jgi:hypothetical protein
MPISRRRCHKSLRGQFGALARPDFKSAAIGLNASHPA